MSITDISTEEDFRKTKKMYKAILCLVFVIALSSTSNGRVIGKISSGKASDFGGQINKAGDFDSDAIRSALQSAIFEKLKKEDAFANSDKVDFFGNLGRKKRSPGFANM